MAGLSARLTARPDFVPHVLHDPGRSWPETNCYTDLWIELLASRGETPEAAFGFAVTQAHEGDQFTFAKIPPEDLRALFGLVVQELSIYRSLEQHTALHVARGDAVLLEVDAFYLPDTAATTYRRDHVKTTMAVDGIDPGTGTATYFHNAARGVLVDEDYQGAFRLRPEFDTQPDLLPPYVELVKRIAPPLDNATLRATSIDLLRGHLSRRPARSPFAVWREAFAGDIASLAENPDGFHDYAFHFPRSIGANFELLGSHARWLASDQLGQVGEACDRIAQTAKVLQFRLARAVARKRIDPCDDCFDSFESAYATVVGGLAGYAS